MKEAAERINVLENDFEDMSGKTGGGPSPEKVPVEEKKEVEEEKVVSVDDGKSKDKGSDDEIENPIPRKKEVKNKSYPFKEPFLERMRYSREWLDLGEMEMGLGREINLKDFPMHEYVMMDVFDIVEDNEQRDLFFEKLMK